MDIRYIELFLLIAVALISDIRTYKIKNVIIFIFIILGLATNLYLNGWQGIPNSTLAALLPVLLLIILFALRMLGAGDIKLFCAVGSIAGIRFVLYNIAYSFIAGGIIAIIIMLVNKNFKERCKYLLSYIKSCFFTLSLQPYTEFSNKADGSKFHFAYAVAFGTLIEILSNIKPFYLQ